MKPPRKPRTPLTHWDIVQERQCRITITTPSVFGKLPPDPEGLLDRVKAAIPASLAQHHRTTRHAWRVDVYACHGSRIADIEDIVDRFPGVAMMVAGVVTPGERI